MKWYSKLLLALALVGVVGIVAVAQTVYRGDVNLIDDVAGTSQFQVGGSDIIKCMQFNVDDSISANSATLGVVTLPRAILVKQVDVFVGTTYAPDTDTAAIIRFRSGATGVTAWLDSNATYQSTDMTDVSFSASAQCSLLTTDGGGTETGGIGGVITVWYTDD